MAVESLGTCHLASGAELMAGWHPACWGQQFGAANIGGLCMASYLNIEASCVVRGGFEDSSSAHSGLAFCLSSGRVQVPGRTLRSAMHINGSNQMSAF